MSDDTSIRPVEFHASDEALASLRRRIGDALPPCAVGLASGSMIFNCSKIEPGRSRRARCEPDPNRERWASQRTHDPAMKVGLAAWMLDHDARSYALIARVFAGRGEGLTRDDVLDNVTLAFLAPRGVAIPVAVSAFPDEIYTAPRSWTERAYPKLIHYSRLPKGGHFAPWEPPQLFAEALRAAFKPLRTARTNVARPLRSGGGVGNPTGGRPPPLTGPTSTTRVTAWSPGSGRTS